MKIGDKVRFLNAVGGGMIKGFQGKDIVLVEDEDGFDIPVHVRECVIVGETTVKEAPKQAASKQTFTPQPLPEEKPKVVTEETAEGELITAVLAFLPIDEKNLSTSAYETYLVNDSNYFLNYTYLNRTEKGWMVRNQGEIEPNTQSYLDEFGKDELNDLEKICIQFTAYKKDKPFKLKNAYSIELTIDTVKFYKLHSFCENDYFEDNALIYTLVRRDSVDAKKEFSADDIKQAMFEKGDNRRPRIQPIKKKESPILEIDLHITELLDNTNGLSNADMLQYQLEKFNEVMTENRRNKGQKIVLIHGKGDGVLKKAVLEELKKKYSSAYVQDASFREYGFGATMVTIK